MSDLATDIEPLGPRWARSLDEAELARRVGAEPELLAPLPEAVRAGRGLAVYPLTDGARESVGAVGDGVLFPGCVCALGAFDGVHVGHRSLVSAALAEARERRAAAVAVTFDPDPADVLSGVRAGTELLPVRDRVRLLASLGVDAVVCVPFTEGLATTDHVSFLREWLHGLLGVRTLHVGSDFRMGAAGAGTVRALREAGEGLGVSVFGHDLVEAAGAPVSATRIRGLVRTGAVDEAAELLGRDHVVRGEVVRGRGEGTAFGFPTANVALSERSCLPAEGVYAAFAIGDGRAWPAAVNVGAPRTFGGQEGEAFLEATLLGYSGDLYGSELAVSFVTWLREPRKFPSLEVLERTVLGNVAWVRTYLSGSEIRLGRGGVA